MSKQIEEIIIVSGSKGLVSYESKKLKEWIPMYGEKALSHSFLMDVLRKIMGKTLTVIDSSITDPKQNKAIKDLIRGIISAEIEFSSEFAFNQEELQKQAEEHFKDKTDEEIEENSVSIEEMLGVK